MTTDPIAEGLAAGWKATDASRLERDQVVDADVAIVGTGAGGGFSADILASAGLSVAMIEEGPLLGTGAFRMRESEAYPRLYQESAARKTRDKGINILQGRCVGGSTTVNWTSSFRTPPATLAFWRQRFGLQELTEEGLAAWFEAVERRLGVREWDVAPNENNAVLGRGARALGLPFGTIRRNVRGCWNLGYCGMGCPTNAKQSMLVTTVPSALSRGARLFSRLRAERLVLGPGGAERLECVALDADGMIPTGRTVTVRARHFVLCGGAIGTPALLMRSRAPDPHGRLGRRTFLHPTLISAALMDQPVAGYAGAPQSLYSDHFLEQLPIDGPLGFKLEAPPLHPVIFATTLHGAGAAHAELMSQFAHAQALLALVRDGFNPESDGGVVSLRGDGSPLLDYPLNAVFWEAARRAFLAMAEIQFAAGARRVYIVDERCPGYASWDEARRAISELPLEALLTRVVSAHVMGGCGMAREARDGVVDVNGRHHQIANVTVVDGSAFPTSIGANPQLSIYALAARNASALARELTGRPAPGLG